MSKKRRKQRVVGRVPQTRQTLPTPVPELQIEQAVPVQTEQEETGVLWKAEYVFHQHYEVTIDENLGEVSQEDLPRLKRMLRSLVRDRKALYAVCEYLVLLENEDASTYIKERYGDMNTGLGDILEEHANCFDLEDREMLSLLDYALLDRGVIQLKPSGFCVVEEH